MLMTSQRPSQVDRRSFLGKLSAGAAAAVAFSKIGSPLGSLHRGTPAPAEIGPMTDEERRQAALRMREDMARLAYDRPLAAHVDNGDESAYASRVGSYSKGLPHDALGHVDPA